MKKFSKSVEYWHGKKANEVLERDGVCVMCDSDKDLVVHHIESVRGGGKSTLSNQRLLCRSCHSKLHNNKPLSVLTPIGKYLRRWRAEHPMYNTEYQREWRKKHPGYFEKYRESKWNYYREANG